MTDEDRFLLKELRTNTERLFQEYKKQKSEKEELMDNITVLTGEIARLEQERDDICRQNEKIKLANRILSSKDEDGNAKKRLNKLVREIDKCIALLNK